jgi:hypothetical protein
MSQIILYDLSSKGGNASWSINPLKCMFRALYGIPPTQWEIQSQTSANNLPARLVLNFKGLDYSTTWVEYSDIAQTLKSL